MLFSVLLYRQKYQKRPLIFGCRATPKAPLSEAPKAVGAILSLNACSSSALCFLPPISTLYCPPFGGYGPVWVLVILCQTNETFFLSVSISFSPPHSTVAPNLYQTSTKPLPNLYQTCTKPLPKVIQKHSKITLMIM